MCRFGESKLRVLPMRVRPILFDQFAKAEPLVKFTHQDQAAVRRNARTLEADLERSIKGKLKGRLVALEDLEVDVYEYFDGHRLAPGMWQG